MAIIGSEYDDLLTGDSSNNTLIGNGGNDVLNGENGLDTLEGGSGNDTLNGGLGTDTATYANSTSGITINNLAKWYALVEDDGLGGTDKLYDIENIIGSDYDDYIRKDNGDSSNSTLKGGKGDDKLYGGKGADSLDGGDDNDFLWGGVGTVSDTLIGGKGDDTLNGDFGNDSLQGGQGNDRLLGGYGNDILRGGSGEDNLDGGRGSDTLYGGSNFDTASYWSSTKGIVIDLSNQSVNNDGFGGKDELYGIENITGSHHADKITGDAANNTLIGNGGNDTLHGGAGVDTLVGGNDADIFVFKAGDSSTDIIQDFNATQGDRIQVEVKAQGVSFDYTYSGTDLTLTFSGRDIAILENIASDDVASVLKQIELTGTSYTNGFNNVFLGDSANNSYFSTSNPFGVDYVYGGDGNDTLDGGLNHDVILGGDGNDVLIGNMGVDILIGGYGSDTFVFDYDSAISDGDDWILDFTASEGDIIQINVEDYYDFFQRVSFDYTYSGTDLTLSVCGHPYIAVLENIASDDVASVLKQIEFTGTSDTTATTDSDVFVGDSANNRFSTSFGDDFVYGGDGNDTLISGWNDDVVLGGDGNDVLVGGGNNDVLIGGYGSDTFVFEYYSAQAGSDRILDFTSAEGDIIEIDQSEYGISSLNEVSFNDANGELSIGNNILTTVENYDTFAVNNDVVLV